MYGTKVVVTNSKPSLISRYLKWVEMPLLLVLIVAFVVLGILYSNHASYTVHEDDTTPTTIQGTPNGNVSLTIEVTRGSINGLWAAPDGLNLVLNHGISITLVKANQPSWDEFIATQQNASDKHISIDTTFRMPATFASSATTEGGRITGDVEMPIVGDSSTFTEGTDTLDIPVQLQLITPAQAAAAQQAAAVPFYGSTALLFVLLIAGSLLRLRVVKSLAVSRNLGCALPFIASLGIVPAFIAGFTHLHTNSGSFFLALGVGGILLVWYFLTMERHYSITETIG
jgi:hypothetical protein